MTAMSARIDPSLFVQTIKHLALEASVSLLPTSPAYRQILARMARPIDYMRCAEFVLVFAQLSLEPGMNVLDVGSPQWFSLCLADLFPHTHFHYVNLLESELEQIQDVAKCLGMGNINYSQQDVRCLGFDSCSFDRAISISVIEHVAPEAGGDIQALKEFQRVLKSDGKLTLSIPLKEVRSVLYVDKPVYEGSMSRVV